MFRTTQRCSDIRSSCPTSPPWTGTGSSFFPAVDALSDAQLEALTAYESRGGTIVALQGGALRNENLDPRPAQDRLPDGVLRVDDAGDAARRAARGMPWRIEAPESVTVDVWSSMSDATFDIHFVNYDADVNAEFVRPVESIVFEGRIPGQAAADQALLVLPDASVYVLPVRQTTRGVRFELPPLEEYAVVTFADAATLRRTAQWMRDRIRRDRAAVRRIARDQDLY